MTTSDYTDLTGVKAFAHIASDETIYDVAITDLITPISRAIDDYCKRWFYARTETRRFDYQDGWRLRLNADLLSVTTLTNGDGYVYDNDAPDYYLYPVIGPPYRWIDLNRARSHPFVWWNTPQQALTVTGEWGYSAEPPAQIVSAANIWITYLLQLGPNAGVQSKTEGEFSTSYEMLVDKLKDPPGAVRRFLDEKKARRISSARGAW